jgi:hypothetical protein
MPAPVTRIAPTWPRLAFLPGLEATQGPNAHPAPYRTVFFGATHEYAEDEGWTTVHYRSRNKRKQRRWRDLNE